MAKPDLSPDQRGRPSAREFAETLRALRDPKTPEEIEESRRFVDGARRTAARIRRGLPSGGSAEVRRTRIGPGPSGEILSKRIGPGPSSDVLDAKIGGPEVADYFEFGEDNDGFEVQARPLRIHELPQDVDPETTEEA